MTSQASAIPGAPALSRWRDLPPREFPPAPTDLSQAPPGPKTPRHILGVHWLLAEHHLLERCRRSYGEIFTLRIWPMGVLVVVGDPAEIKRVFTADADQLRAGEANSLMEPVAGPESILLLDGKRHINRRKMMLPPFHGERMSLYRQLIDDITSEEVQSWPTGKPFSAHISMQKITLRVILRAVLGIEDSSRGGELEQLLPKLLNSPALMSPILRRDLGPYSPWQRFAALRERVDSMLFEEIAHRRSDPHLSEREDILAMLLQARDENGQEMTDEELRDQLVTLLLAGHETTAAALAWMFERVVRLPAIHERLRAAAADGDEQYLDCFIKEGLRARPVVPMAIRRVTAPFPIGSYTVPAGTVLGCSMLLAHSNPELYPEPHAFRPERFMEGAPDTYTWIPFGGGVRRCIGVAFATLEMKVILRNVFSRCALQAPPRAKPERPRRRFVTYPPNRGAQVVLVKGG
ncbi:MAG TPA: cytochrome P450 [Solirubrobacteraceae bacterium]|nr:cytochrome P450 [Solirubrobacteraceae bacterium]